MLLLPLGKSNKFNKDLKNSPHQKKFILNKVTKFMIIIDSSYRKVIHSPCLSSKTKTKNHEAKENSEVPLTEHKTPTSFHAWSMMLPHRKPRG